MCWEFLLHLKAVLHFPKKQVGLTKAYSLVWLDDFVFCKLVDGIESGAYLQEWLLACMKQLQPLHKEFNFPDASLSCLDVAAVLRVLLIPAKTGSCCGQFPYQAWRRMPWMGEGMNFFQKLSTQGGIPCNRSGARKGQAFPGLPNSVVVVYGRLKVLKKRPRLAFWAKPQVHVV